MEPQPILNKLIFLVLISDQDCIKFIHIFFYLCFGIWMPTKYNYPSERLYYYSIGWRFFVLWCCTAGMRNRKKAKTYDQVVVGGDARSDCKFLGLQRHLCS